MTVREKLHSGKTSLGSWIQIPDQTVAEIMGNAGYDWIAVDMEHGAITLENLPGLFRSISIAGTQPFVRLAKADGILVRQALDAGAEGVILPMIETAEQLTEAVSVTLYPPEGTRGVGYCRANAYGKDFDNYLETQSKEIVVVAQIEHINAVDNLDDILKVKPLDAIIVGPYDLSASMDLTAKFDHPDFCKALDAISEKANNANIPMGLHIVQPDKDLLAKKISEGYRFIAWGTDAVFLYRGCECPEN